MEHKHTNNKTSQQRDCEFREFGKSLFASRPQRSFSVQLKSGLNWQSSNDCNYQGVESKRFEKISCFKGSYKRHLFGELIQELSKHYSIWLEKLDKEKSNTGKSSGKKNKRLREEGVSTIFSDMLKSFHEADARFHKANSKYHKADSRFHKIDAKLHAHYDKADADMKKL